MATIFFEDITLTSTGVGGSVVTYGTQNGLYLEQIDIIPSGTNAPLASWDLTVTEKTTNRAIYSNTALSATARTVAVPRIGTVNTTNGNSITNVSEKFMLGELVKLFGENMGTTGTATVRAWYRRE